MAKAQETVEVSNDATVLDEDDAALVVSADGEISFHMPDYGEEDEVPPLVAALGLLAIKLQDEQFVEDLLAELAEEDDEEADPDEVEDEEAEEKPAKS